MGTLLRDPVGHRLRVVLLGAAEVAWSAQWEYANGITSAYIGSSAGTNRLFWMELELFKKERGSHLDLETDLKAVERTCIAAE